jgi:hypothetical protein
VVKRGNLKILVDGWIAWIMCHHGASSLICIASYVDSVKWEKLGRSCVGDDY